MTTDRPCGVWGCRHFATRYQTWGKTGVWVCEHHYRPLTECGGSA